MKKEFYVGERVAVYQADIGRTVGTIIEFDPNSMDSYGVDYSGLLAVKFSGDNVDWGLYCPQQLRHLKKKPRKEFWICYPKDKTPPVVSYWQPEEGKHGYAQVVHVREVRDKK